MRGYRFGMLALAAVMAAVLPRGSLAQEPIVKIETATPSNAGLSRVFFGTVVARETVDLAFQVGGQIVEFPVEEGAFVPAGTMVAKLDQEPFELALEEARARAEQAERTLARYRQLEGSSVSETTVKDAETDVELARVALRNAEYSMEHATLHAPFDGLVAARLTPNYTTISAGTPVVRLHDMSELRVEIEVPETLFQQAGQNPDVRIEAKFPGNPESYPLEMREYNAETSTVGQTYTITLGMVMPDDLTALPGSSARVTATLLSDDASVEVPSSAIVTGNDGSTFLMIFTPTGANRGTVTRTPVEIAATGWGTVRVVSGLEEGQEYVAIGGSQLTDGATVRRFIGFQN